MQEQVVLVDKNNKEIGCEEKLSAHIHGSLHRAFSVFIFNSSGELLIQQRNREKYHTPGLWSNTCCSHPFPGEELSAAVTRRLNEEMGFSCECQEITTCYYRFSLENSLIEHEHDHIFIGFHDGDPDPNPSEVENWDSLPLYKLVSHMRESPYLYTPWFLLIMKEHWSLINNTLSASRIIHS
jgi:isopentenyl-diphosphate Delta-isomerase